MKIIDISDIKNAKELREQGNIFFKNGEFMLALVCYQRARDMKPKIPEAWYNIGRCLQEKGLLKLAIENYEEAIELKSDFHQAFFNLGNVYSDLDEFELAIKHYKKAIEFNEDYYQAYFNLGVLHFRMNNLELANDNYLKTVEINPKMVEAWTNLGVVYAHKGKIEQALENIRKALEIDPKFKMACNIREILLEIIKTSNEIKSTNKELKSITNKLSKINEKENSGKPIDENEKRNLEAEDKWFKENKENLNGKSNELNDQRKYFKEFAVLFDLLHKIEFGIKQNQILDNVISQITKMISKLDEDYYKLVLMKIAVDKKTQLNIKKNIDCMPESSLKEEAERIFSQDFQTIKPIEVMKWIEDAIDYIGIFEIYRVIKNILMGIQIKDSIFDLDTKFKTLIIIPDVTDMDKLDGSGEVSSIVDLILTKEQLFFEPIIKLAVSKDRLVGLIRKYQPNIIHFTGHADVNGWLGLRVDTLNGETEGIDPVALAGAFKLLEKKLKCLFLSACYTDKLSELLDNSADCVIGMNKQIDEDVATYFALGFYESIKDGTKISKAIEDGIAQARVMLLGNMDQDELEEELTKPSCVSGRKNPKTVCFNEQSLRIRNLELT